MLFLSIIIYILLFSFLIRLIKIYSESLFDNAFFKYEMKFG